MKYIHLVFSFIYPIIALEYSLKVLKHEDKTAVSYIDGTSDYSLVFNPSWIVEHKERNIPAGLLMRTQNCTVSPGDPCSFCGGSEAKASVLTFAELKTDGTFVHVDASSVVFGPYDDTDSWGTEDPRVLYNPNDGLYYMFYTAYNGKDIYLSLATSEDPTINSSWNRHGPVFPGIFASKSGALLLREDGGPHYLYWGDSSIKIAKSYDPKAWPADGGEVFIEVRPNHFDSKLVESGPPPLLLSTGDYLFFYNSASAGWPDAAGSAYNPGWVILDGANPSIIKQRSEVPILSPMYNSEFGTTPYTCNVPNVIFLEAAREIGVDTYEVYFGAADAAIGSAIIQVTSK
jgi:predicted GH43/DUF377 family glycosyl hydrolase